MDVKIVNQKERKIMSILIKDMDMPKECRSCPFEMYYFACGETRCRATNKILANNYNVISFDGRADWCPLIELPPYGRLIDGDKISEHKYATIPQYRKEYSDGKPKSDKEVIAFKFGWNYAIDAIISNAPTVIEAEEDE